MTGVQTCALPISAGALLSTPTSGTIEWDGSLLYATNSSNARKTVAYVDNVHYIGTTPVPLNRASGTQTLSGVNIDGNSATVSSISSAQIISALGYTPIDSSSFPSGTRLLFQQTTAPTGWTKDTTAALNDSILRIVTGTVSSGGSTAFSTFNTQSSTAAYTLAVGDIPSHNHIATSTVSDPGHSHTYDWKTADMVQSGGATACWVGHQTVNTSTSYTSISVSTSIANSGGGNGHSHGITTNIKYNDVIIGVKT